MIYKMYTNESFILVMILILLLVNYSFIYYLMPKINEKIQLHNQKKHLNNRKMDSNCAKQYIAYIAYKRRKTQNGLICRKTPNRRIHRKTDACLIFYKKKSRSKKKKYKKTAFIIICTN